MHTKWCISKRIQNWRLLKTLHKMFLSFLFLLSFRSKYRIYSSLQQTKLEDFGFDNNGTFSYSFQIPETFEDNISLLLLNSTLYAEQRKSIFGYILFTLCDNETLLNMAVSVNQSHPKFSGKIEKKTVIYPYLLRCNTSNSEFLDLNLLIEYRNQNSFLDTRIRPAIISNLVIFILYLIFIGVWFANWAFHFEMKIHLHNILTITLFLFSLAQVLRYYELKVLDKSDESHGLTEIRLGFVTISFFFLSLFLLFVSYGLNICFEKIPWYLIIVYIVLSLWVSIFPNLYFHAQFGKNQRYVVLMIFIGAVAFVIAMIINAKHSMARVIPLLLASPSTLPATFAYLINGIYYSFLWCVLSIIFSSFVVGILFLTVPTIPIWVDELLLDLIVLFGLIAFCFVFRLRPNKNIYTADDEISSLSACLSITPEQPLLLENDNI